MCSMKKKDQVDKEPIVIHFKGCTEYSSLTYRCIKIEDLRELSRCPVVLDQNIVTAVALFPGSRPFEK